MDRSVQRSRIIAVEIQRKQFWKKLSRSFIAWNRSNIFAWLPSHRETCQKSKPTVVYLLRRVMLLHRTKPWHALKTPHLWHGLALSACWWIADGLFSLNWFLVWFFNCSMFRLFSAFLTYEIDRHISCSCPLLTSLVSVLDCRYHVVCLIPMDSISFSLSFCLPLHITKPHLLRLVARLCRVSEISRTCGFISDKSDTAFTRSRSSSTSSLENHPNEAVTTLTFADTLARKLGHLFIIVVLPNKINWFFFLHFWLKQTRPFRLLCGSVLARVPFWWSWSIWPHRENLALLNRLWFRLVVSRWPREMNDETNFVVN